MTDSKLREKIEEGIETLREDIIAKIDQRIRELQETPHQGARVNECKKLRKLMEKE